MFACQHENVIPDVVILAKALTGVYLPIAITLLTEQIFSTFAASSEAEKTLYYGHSYTGNALACAAASASLEIFEEENVLEALVGKIDALRSELASLRDLPWVASVRQCGLIAGVELRADHDARLGAAMCLAARKPRTPNETDPQRDRLDATFLHHALSVAPGHPSHRVRDCRGLWRKRACLKW